MKCVLLCTRGDEDDEALLMQLLDLQEKASAEGSRWPFTPRPPARLTAAGNVRKAKVSKDNKQRISMLSTDEVRTNTSYFA